MAEWYVNNGDMTQRPFTSLRLKRLASRLKISATTQVRLGNDGQWVAASNVKNLFALVPGARTVGPPPIVHQRLQPQTDLALNKSGVARNGRTVANENGGGEEELLKIHPSMLRNESEAFVTSGSGAGKATDEAGGQWRRSRGCV